MSGSGPDRGSVESNRSEVASLATGDRLVFIGGLHRSGTSIIHRCLGDHPQVSGFRGTGVAEDEGQHLQSVYLPAAAHGGPGLFGLDPASYLDERSPLATPENAHRILSEWIGHWDTSREILVEKSPPNLVRTRFLQRLFPMSRFVIVLRHPVAVAYATQKWAMMFPALRSLGIPDRRLPKVRVHELIEHWLLCHEQFEEDRAHLDRVHVLRYEEFVERPQEHMDALFAFLGLPPAPLEREIQTGVNDRYWRRWMARKRGLLTRTYWRWVVGALDERVSHFGYSLDSLR